MSLVPSVQTWRATCDKCGAVDAQLAFSEAAALRGVTERPRDKWAIRDKALVCHECLATQAGQTK